MIPGGLTSSVVNRASLGDAYVRVRDSGLVAAVAESLYDETALLDEWLAPLHPTAAKYLIPTPKRPQRRSGHDPASTAVLERNAGARGIASQISD